MAKSPNARDDNLVPERTSGGGPGPSRDDAGEETNTDMEIVEEVEEGKTVGPVPVAVRGQSDLTPITYRIGRSRATEANLDKYVEQGLLKASLRGLCHAPGQEEVPRPEPYETVVFHDFFEPGLRFPCEVFVGKVLQWFNLQIHHLTPNAFAWLGIFAMALMMSGYDLSVNTFARYYETHLHKKVVKDKRTKVEMVAHYGSYNFIPKKTKGTVQIVPAYQNKWPRWTDYWFYHRVCSDEDVTEALTNDLPKAHILVSEMTSMRGFHLFEVLVNGPCDTEAADAFALTYCWQISRDLVDD